MSRLGQMGVAIGILLSSTAITGWAQLDEQPAPPNAPTPPVSGNEDTPNAERSVARLGIAVKEAASAEDSNALQTGLDIAVVVSGSPAANAGLKSGDRLTQFNEQILIVPKQLEVLVKRSAVGAQIRLSYERSGQEKTADVVLDAAPLWEAPPHHENVFAEEFRVTRRVVRVIEGSTTIAMSTQDQKAHLVISDAENVRFDGPVTEESEIPQDMLPRIKRVAELENGQWVFNLPLLPPVELEPEDGPRPPAPEPD